MQTTDQYSGLNPIFTMLQVNLYLTGVLQLDIAQLTVLGLVKFLASVSQLLRWLYVLRLVMS